MTEPTRTIIVRDLIGTDAEAFQRVRLRSLKEHPTAFGSAYEDEKDFPLEQTAEHLDRPTTERFILGAFLGDDLIGIIGGYRDSLRKCRHRAHIGAMYVASEARGIGAGRRLLLEAVQRLQAMEEVEEVILAV
ncbi:MAG TPA: GNAT family N-acetyltransferase, partial [Phototrophicaceae bacterium]|nr:GNAT family N-acetyltransferase [Phototrophicaceae bacterium]